MSLLADELKLTVSTQPATPKIDPKYIVEEDVYLIPYDENGNRLPLDSNNRQHLDLREDAVVRLTCGQFAGDKGVVISKHSEGHFRIQFRHNIGGAKKTFMAPMLRTLGWWWIQEATEGRLQSVPVVNVK
jgi:hypothetical protein